MISLAVPAGATTTSATFYVASLSSPSQVSQGDIDIDIRALRNSDGSSISSFSKVLDIHYWTQFVNAVPRIVENGNLGVPVSLLGSAVLPVNLSSGYFIYSDRTYSVLTRTLSSIYFDLVQDPLMLKVKNLNLRVGDTAQLQFTGGSGSGELLFTSDNPGICTVTTSGVVAALKPGLCTVRLTKSADQSHLSTTADDVTFLVTLSRQELRSQTSPRNQLIYFRPAGDYKVLVNLASSYANKTGTLQYRRYERGILVYRPLGEVTLNVNGNAVYYGESWLLNGTRIRLVVDGVNIAFTTAKH